MPGLSQQLMKECTSRLGTQGMVPSGSDRISELEDFSSDINMLINFQCCIHKQQDERCQTKHFNLRS